MQTQELLNIFSQFTREDWNDFDNIRQVVFQPTQAEIDEQNLQQELYKQNEINNKLLAL